MVDRRQLRLAKEKVWEAEQQYIDAIAENYPRGSKAEYGQGRGVVSCTVLEHSDMRLRVQSDKSGKKYWVHISRLI